MILTVELQNQMIGEVAICFDAEGLDVLLERLNYLKEHVDHLHLMTPSWAGQELTEEMQASSGYTLINSLRLVRVADKPK